MKVLCIEDNAFFMEKLVRAIAAGKDSREVEFTLTNHLSAADGIVGNTKFDVIFSDHDLPDGDSPGFVKKWQDEGKLDRTQTYVVGISGGFQNNERLLASGAHVCVMKDPGFEEHIKMIMTELETGHRSPKEDQR